MPYKIANPAFNTLNHIYRMGNYQSTLKLEIGQLIWNPDKISKRPLWLNIIVPLVLTLMATGIKMQFFNNTDYQVPFLLFFGVIVLSTAYGGTNAGIFSLLFTLLSSFLFFVSPTERFDQQNITLFELVSFLVAALLVIGLIHVIQLTHLKLKKSEEKFRGIVEKSNEGFFMAKGDGEILYTCTSMHNMLGLTEEQFTSKSFFNLLNNEDGKKLHLKFIDLLSKPGQSVAVRHQIKTGSNNWMWVETSITNLLNDDQINALLFHCRNIDDTVHRQQQQEDFVSITSHELKTPITALKGYIQLLHRKIEREDNLKLIGRMEAQVEKISSLIADMADTTQINTGEVHYFFSPFNLTDCIKDAVDAILFNNKSHKINCSFSAAAILVNGDKSGIGQVIINLVTNAIKYSPDSDSIDVICDAENGKVLVSITDYGIGIPKEKQEKIFDRFYRVDTLPKGVFKGLGLGLYITAEIIKRHKGTIGVESSEGAGSTFWFTLPQN